MDSTDQNWRDMNCTERNRANLKKKMNWTEENWIEVNRTELTEQNWNELNRTNRTELNWTEMNRTKLNRSEMNRTEHPAQSPSDFKDEGNFWSLRAAMTATNLTIFTVHSTAVIIRITCVGIVHVRQNTQQDAMCSANGTLNGGRTKAIWRYRPTGTVTGRLSAINPHLTVAQLVKTPCKQKIHYQSIKCCQQSLP